MSVQTLKSFVCGGLTLLDSVNSTANNLVNSFEKNSKSWIQGNVSPVILEKMGSMTDKILKTTPHAIMYFLFFSNIAPALSVVYFSARAIKVLRPVINTVIENIDNENKDAAKSKMNDAQKAVQVAAFAEVKETVVPSMTLTLSVGAGLYLVTLAPLKAAVCAAAAFGLYRISPEQFNSVVAK